MKNVNTLLLILCTTVILVVVQSDVFAVPVSQLSTGRVKISLTSDISYTWSFSNGSMLVNINNLSTGSWVVEAKRVNKLGRLVTLGKQELSICSGYVESIQVEVWPTEGKVFQSDTYPVISVKEN